MLIRRVRQLAGGWIIICAELDQTRVGCSEAAENFWLTANDQFYSRKKQFQARLNNTTLPPRQIRWGHGQSQPHLDKEWTSGVEICQLVGRVDLVLHPDEAVFNFVRHLWFWIWKSSWRWCFKNKSKGGRGGKNGGLISWLWVRVQTGWPDD